MIELIANLSVVKLELVSKELNHLAAILHVYARGLNFQKENGNTFTLLIIFIVKSLQQAGNALARVQRVHEPADLCDITFCTR